MTLEDYNRQDAIEEAAKADAKDAIQRKLDKEARALDKSLLVG